MAPYNVQLRAHLCRLGKDPRDLQRQIPNYLAKIWDGSKVVQVVEISREDLHFVRMQFIMVERAKALAQAKLGDSINCDALDGPFHICPPLGGVKLIQTGTQQVDILHDHGLELKD